MTSTVCPANASLAKSGVMGVSSGRLGRLSCGGIARRRGMRMSRGAGPVNEEGADPKVRPRNVSLKRLGYMPMPMSGMPAPAAAASSFFSGFSATIASVVMSRPATEAASCSAVRTTLAGSMMPAFTMST